MTLEVGDEIIRGHRRLTVVAMTGDPSRVWVAPLTAGLVRGRAEIIEVEPFPLCECGCGERVSTVKNGIPSRWRPGHHQRLRPRLHLEPKRQEES